MISVAMATYNGEKYIIEQLDSIRNQSLTPDEVVICDDRSTDHTVSLIETYIDKYSLNGWQIHVNEQNLGYINNFWKAILLTRGDYIFLSDQDDVWMNNKIEMMVGIMKKNDALMLHTEVDVIDNEHNIIRKSMNKLPEGLQKVNYREYLRKSHYCGMSSAMSGKIRKLMLPLATSSFPTHDWCLGFLASSNYGFYTFGTVFSLRRSHGNNAALNLDAVQRQGIPQRIQTIEQYQALYNSALEILKNNSQDPIIYSTVCQFIKVNEIRKDYLIKRSIINAIVNLRFLRWYPSIKAWFSDLLYIIGAF